MPQQDFTITLVSAAANVVLTAAAFTLVRRYAPAKSPGVDAETLAALRKKYVWFTLAGLLPMFAVIGGITWLLYRGLRLVSDWVVSRHSEGAEFVITPEPAALLLPAFFPAIFLATFPMMWLARLLLGDVRYREFYLVSRYGDGYDAVRGLALLAAVFVPICAGLACLIVDHYVVVTPSELVVNPILRFGDEHRRPLSDVVAVYAVAGVTAPDGKVKRRPYHLVRFRDGSEWTTREGGRTTRPATDGPIIEYIAAQAGVSVQPVSSPPPSK